MKKTIIAAVLAIALAAAGSAFAQGGYGGYGMGPGMMGGMMGGYGRQGFRQVSYSAAEFMLAQTAKSAHIDKVKNQVRFSGDRIEIAMAAVQPDFPDTTFEVAGLVDPTIFVPAGSLVTIDFVNMDYGYRMNHGLVITTIPPLYPVLSMMGMPDTLVGVPILPPRQLKDATRSLYAESSVTFRTPPPGTYYYLCQYYNHANKGMYGRFVVTPN
jgi:rusticyanin